MIHEDIQLSGSLQISGSFALPLAANPSSISNPLTGSIIIDQSDNNKARIYNGNEWEEIAGQGAVKADIGYLIVAGGGGGSSGIGNGNGTGGGGAGGMLSSSLADIESGSKFTVTVGAGGNGGSPSTYAGRSSAQRGTDGTDSSITSAAGTSFTTVTAIGGGSGGRYYDDNTGNDGGSGGGGASYSGAGGSGTTGQGNDGGVATPSGDSTYRGGGGGGKSAAGATGAISGNGGAGQASNITGTAVNYAGGGGGGTYTAAGGSGGTGGGGAGSNQGNTAGSGTTNTGGGGGGGGWPASSNSTGGQGGSGGSGVVVLGFPTASLSASGSQHRYFFGDRVAHTFNSSGTFSVKGPVTHTHDTLDVFGDSSCLALYQFEDNANDKSGNYNGTASNLTYAQGYINNAGVFNGSNAYIDLGTSIATSTRGVSIWVNADNFSERWPFQQGDGQGVENYIRFYNTDDIQVRWGNVTQTFSGYSANTWIHIFAQKDENDNANVWINGVEMGSTGTPSAIAVNKTQIGRRYNNNSYQYYFDGKIDQVRIFNKALSASEITTLYNE